MRVGGEGSTTAKSPLLGEVIEQIGCKLRSLV